ncbi:2-dehydropantoate 2-reductase [Marinobacter sp. SS21]|uniref:2-dehydropantoate 2-reductase n=1 Tax=Marinobacter sp. SS21 TaxID=2979460 RepID=UPI00232A9DBC|nr:2-dehydropantoate 2-reductase [Marinobacter sp. SS21]MDC0663589.1 2-dehydropantoate 2-reductase [Marinobacter sp. SS21]
METSPKPPRVVIFGAGSVGCYLGARLMSADVDVTFVGRPRMQQVLKAHPLRATDYEGFQYEAYLSEGQYVTTPEAAAQADLVLVTVKSAATEEAGRALAEHVRPGTPVISLQNGISNAERLRSVMPGADVLAGMVPFNVLQKSPGHFHHGTEGHLMTARHSALTALLPRFIQAGLPLELRDDMLSVMWSKLLLNLNNPINALSGVPLLKELSQRDYRRCLALAQEETLALLKDAKMPLVKLTGVPMALIPKVMRLPDWLFTRLARTMLAIDPLARSSMWEDLEAGRPTEVDWINGEVVRLAGSLGQQAPINARLTELVRECEQQRRSWSGADLLRALTH